MRGRTRNLGRMLILTTTRAHLNHHWSILGAGLRCTCGRGHVFESREVNCNIGLRLITGSASKHRFKSGRHEPHESFKLGARNQRRTIWHTLDSAFTRHLI